MPKRPEKHVAVKSIDEFKHSEPEQLELFLLVEPEEQSYSNTIELYDFLPKYFAPNGRSKEQAVPTVIERPFEFRGQLYTLTIKPARIKNNLGHYMICYPGEREEIIEDVIRKIACEQKFPFLDDIPSVAFTIYQLKKHLKDIHHSFTYAEIIQALKICVDTTLEIRSADGKVQYYTHIFQTLFLSTREEMKGEQKPVKSFVRLNELVSNSIHKNTFRRINYECLMSIKNPLARRLYKRLSHSYTYAKFLEPDNSYHLLLSTILRDFGLKEYGRVRDNIRVVKKALDELKAKGIIADYFIEKATDPQIEGDVKFILKAGYKLASDMKAANYRQNINQLKLI